MLHSKNLKIIIIITIIIIIIIILMMMMMMTIMMIMITIITEILKDFPYVWYEEYLHNSSFYKKDRIQCNLYVLFSHFRRCYVTPKNCFILVLVSILYEKTKARSLESIKSSALGKTYKLRRSVILFYQYGRRDVMRKRSITKGIPSRNFQVTGANYARKLLSTYLVNANNR